MDPRRELVDVAGEAGGRQERDPDGDRDEESQREEGELPAAPNGLPGG